MMLFHEVTHDNRVCSYVYSHVLRQWCMAHLSLRRGWRPTTVGRICCYVPWGKMCMLLPTIVKWSMSGRRGKRMEGKKTPVDWERADVTCCSTNNRRAHSSRQSFCKVISLSISATRAAASADRSGCCRDTVDQSTTLGFSQRWLLSDQMLTTGQMLTQANQAKADPIARSPVMSWRKDKPQAFHLVANFTHWHH